MGAAFGFWELMSASLPAADVLTSCAKCDPYPGSLWELNSVISYLKLPLDVVWTEVTSSLSFVQHLKSCRVFENGEFEELDYSCWMVLLVASAVWTQGSVLSPEHGIILCFFPEWSKSGKVWFGEHNQEKILRPS